MATRPQQDAPRAPSPTTDQLHSECRISPLELETDMLQNLRVVLQAICRPQGYTESVVRQGHKKSFSSMWKKCKVWCLDEGSHPWLCFDHTQVSVDKACDQLMQFLDFIRPDMRSYSNFCKHKSTIACCFHIVFGFDLSIDIFLSNSG